MWWHGLPFTGFNLTVTSCLILQMGKPRHKAADPLGTSDTTHGEGPRSLAQAPGAWRRSPNLSAVWLQLCEKPSRGLCLVNSFKEAILTQQNTAGLGSVWVGPGNRKQN